jgi:hypothetical protein
MLAIQIRKKFFFADEYYSGQSLELAMSGADTLQAQACGIFYKGFILKEQGQRFSAVLRRDKFGPLPSGFAIPHKLRMTG